MRYRRSSTATKNILAPCDCSHPEKRAGQIQTRCVMPVIPGKAQFYIIHRSIIDRGTGGYGVSCLQIEALDVTCKIRNIGKPASLNVVCGKVVIGEQLLVPHYHTFPILPEMDYVKFDGAFEVLVSSFRIRVHVSPPSDDLYTVGRTGSWEP